jgi:hypothetical protein
VEKNLITATCSAKLLRLAEDFKSWTLLLLIDILLDLSMTQVWKAIPCQSHLLLH